MNLRSKLFATALAITTFQAALTNAQDYKFNIEDKSSYSFSCGNQDNNDWIVRKNSCNFYTAVTNVGGKPGDGNRQVDINMTLSNSGNLDQKDFAWIFYYVNGKMMMTKTLRGDNVMGEFKFRDSLTVPSGGNFKLRIAFVCDEADEFWKLSNGGLTASVRTDGSATVAEEEVQDKETVTIEKERNIVRLKWNTLPGNEGSYFVIERSRNGKDFDFAGYVKKDKEADMFSYIDIGATKPKTWYKVSIVKQSNKKVPVGETVFVTVEQ